VFSHIVPIDGCDPVAWMSRSLGRDVLEVDRIEAEGALAVLWEVLTPEVQPEGPGLPWIAKSRWDAASWPTTLGLTPADPGP
jgi:hypothetical protein